MAAFGWLAAALLATLPWASHGRCARRQRQFFTTGEQGDREGFQCLACPTRPLDEYRRAPNDHPGPLSGAELFVLDYWDAMDRGDIAYMMNNYAGSGELIRAGGPVLMGNQITPLGEKEPFNASEGYESQVSHGGHIFFLYSFGAPKWRGAGGLMSGLRVALQDKVELGNDFAIVTTLINGTTYSNTTGEPLVPWISMKQSITVRNFGGDIGWRIVHFTCSFYSLPWLGESGTRCVPGASSGVPPPHVDWSSAPEYSVKFTDQADYCSRRCPCGEAPVHAHRRCQEEAAREEAAAAPGAGAFSSAFYLTDVPAAAPGGFCLACPTHPQPRPAFEAGSPEQFIVDFVTDLGVGRPHVARLYSEHAILQRNGGPVITGPRFGPLASSAPGLDFFTHLWPGLTYVGSGGATSEMLVAVHRTIRAGHTSAQMLLFINGTLYRKSTGEVVIPWMAKKLMVEVLHEGSGWKVSSLAALDFNTNGVGRCTSDGIPASYCLERCPCGEVVPLPADEAAAERVSYHTIATSFV